MLLGIPSFLFFVWLSHAWDNPWTDRYQHSPFVTLSFADLSLYLTLFLSVSLVILEAGMDCWSHDKGEGNGVPYSNLIIPR